MTDGRNLFLVAGAALSALASLLHLGCIVFGASWYRFFGAGERMAQMADAGRWRPALITLFIAGVLALWAAYALSGAGVIARLPLLRTALCAITAAYLLRGTVILPVMKLFPDNSPAFWWWSSAICLSIGLTHLVGLVQSWSRLSTH